MTECIEWTKAINSSGDGVVWKNGKQHYAHRLVINASKGDVVLHSCDISKTNVLDIWNSRTWRHINV